MHKRWARLGNRDDIGVDVVDEHTLPFVVGIVNSVAYGKQKRVDSTRSACRCDVVVVVRLPRGPGVNKHPVEVVLYNIITSTQSPDGPRVHTYKYG